MKITKNISQLLLLCTLIIFSLSLFAQPAPPTGKQWQPVPELTDDFNTFDGNKWQKGHPYWNGRSPSQYNNTNISNGNGLMRLKMTVRNTDQQGDWMWAACVTSKTKAFKKGMYAEVNVKVANLSAVSSFWMQGNYSEIDVIENYGNVKNNTWRHLDSNMGSNTHYFINGWPNDIKTPRDFPNVGSERNADRYFTYGVWWKDNRNILFYRDGQYVGSAYTGGDFNEDMYMFFDMEPFTWGPGLPTISDLDNDGINSAYYNSVKTYRLIDSNGGNPGAPIGQTIWLKNYENNYVWANLANAGAPIWSNSTTSGGWGQFKVENAGNGKIALKALANNKYLVAESGTNRPIEADRTAIGGWEKFTWESQGGNKVALKAAVNDLYVQARLNFGGDPLQARASAVQGWETFTWGTGSGREGDIIITAPTEESVIQIYPNPIIDGQLKISGLSDQSETEVRILNLEGQIVYQSFNETLTGVQELSLDTDLSTGMYVVEIINGTNSSTQRVTVR